MSGFLLALNLVSLCEAKDVCNGTYITVSDIRRSTAYEYKQGDVMICDRDFINESCAWYRFKSDAGDSIPTTQPPSGHCNTYAPMWLNGQHPVVFRRNS